MLIQTKKLKELLPETLAKLIKDLAAKQNIIGVHVRFKDSALPFHVYIKTKNKTRRLPEAYSPQYVTAILWEIDEYKTIRLPLALDSIFINDLNEIFFMNARDYRLELDRLNKKRLQLRNRGQSLIAKAERMKLSNKIFELETALADVEPA